MLFVIALYPKNVYLEILADLFFLSSGLARSLYLCTQGYFVIPTVVGLLTLRESFLVLDDPYQKIKNEYPGTYTTYLVT